MEEGDKVRREKIGGYFLNLSQLVFVALVLGGISPVYTNEEIGGKWACAVCGNLFDCIVSCYRK